MAKGDEAQIHLEEEMKDLRQQQASQQLGLVVTAWSRFALARAWTRWRERTVLLQVQRQLNQALAESRKGKTTSATTSAAEVERWRVKAQAHERTAEAAKRAEADAKEQMALYEDAFAAEKADLSNQLATAMAQRIKMEMKVDTLKERLQSLRELLGDKAAELSDDGTDDDG